MASVIAGLNNSSITRLKRDWKVKKIFFYFFYFFFIFLLFFYFLFFYYFLFIKYISKHDIAKWQEILSLMNPQGNFKDYKNYIQSIKDIKNEPCIPYFGKKKNSHFIFIYFILYYFYFYFYFFN